MLAFAAMLVTPSVVQAARAVPSVEGIALGMTSSPPGSRRSPSRDGSTRRKGLRFAPIALRATNAHAPRARFRLWLSSRPEKRSVYSVLGDV